VAAAAALLLSAGCANTAAIADEPQEAITDRAARLSYFDAGTQIALEGGSEWVEPRLNLTLAGGDRLRTARDARVEVRWDHGALRLDGDSEVQIDRLTYGNTQLWLGSGVAVLRVSALDESETVSIATGAGVIEILRPGDYRVEAGVQDGDTLLIVRSGLANLGIQGRSYRVRAGEMLRVRSGDTEEPRITAAFGPDGFDRWCDERQERVERSVATRYVPAGVVGYEDLDGYGNWEYASGYGYVWYPTAVQAGWTPYSFGSWMWVSPWGWTWVDSSPWGYAPYHYGSWIRYRARWCWVPGPRPERPHYSPAPHGWRHDRPLRANDGHVYRPPLPPRQNPPRYTRPTNTESRQPRERPLELQRPREDRRITIPERPLNTRPQPRDREAPRDRGGVQRDRDVQRSPGVQRDPGVQRTREPVSEPTLQNRGRVAPPATRASEPDRSRFAPRTRSLPPAAERQELPRQDQRPANPPPPAAAPAARPRTELPARQATPRANDQRREWREVRERDRNERR
jgi:hypothetical protein